MTLRLRLVLALFGLMLVGLAGFGVASYTVYARSERQRLDDQIKSAAGSITRQLIDEQLGNDHKPFDGGGDDRFEVPLSTYAQLRDSSDVVKVEKAFSESTARPALPATIAMPSSDSGRFFETGSKTGSGTWRVFVQRAQTPGSDGFVTVIAVPMGEVESALQRLLVIEIGGGLLLTAVLCGGAWVILRRGLRPLEHMASTAGEIAAGDLALRVTPSDGRSEVGQLGGALNSMLDEIQRAIAERDATEQKLRQFLSDASHELRTPLTSIQGFAELFRLGDSARVDLPTILRRIEEESARMKVLVEDLLLLARLDERRAPERKPVDLAVLAADACSDIKAIAPDRAVTLDVPGPVVVAGDEPQLRQAIGNLVTNAVRHTPPGSPIDVGVVVDGRDAVVSVRDHGPGLPADALEHVFDRFWQADRARAGTGTGLGLAIVEAIATEHGGRAQVENVADGGARFTLRLPLA